VCSHAQLTKEETDGIERALGLWNMSISDLGFEKRLYNDPYRLPIVDKALSAPLDGLTEVMLLQGVARSSGSSLGPVVEAAWSKLQMPSYTSASPVQTHPGDLKAVPAICREQVRQAIVVVQEATGLVNRSLSKLTPIERAELLRALPEIAEAPTARLPRAAKGKAIGREQAFALLGKVDFGLMEAASDRLTRGLQPIVDKLRAVAPQVVVPKTIRLKADGLSVAILSTGEDRYQGKENELVIDFHGNDFYSGYVGTGLGGCGVLIDLGGDDQFDLGDYSGGFGMLGCGVVYDIGGNDRVFAKSCSLGSALGGFGLFFKDGGNDTYKSISCTQGFAMFGVGILEDTKGGDRFDATDYAQGAGLTKGFGWLIDRDGHAVFTIGGRVSGEPLDPKSWYCFGQGAASGFREDTGGESGGIGMLSDLGGHNVYHGGMYCQGASYWFAFGALMDDGGYNTYIADYYSQAAAMHLTAAYLIDLKGDDIFSVRAGAMQGIGHDYGVAMLFNREGNDIYSGMYSTPGVGIANGIGIFLNSGGNNRYFGPPGNGNASRGTGSIGLFVDLGQGSQYGKGFDAGQVSLTGTWGIAVDRTQPPSSGGTAAAPAHVRPKAGTAPMPDDAEMERIYTKATQWGVGSLQQEVEDNVDKLVAIGMPALDWMLKKKLATADRLSLRAFDAVIGAVGDPGKALVPPYAASKEGDAAFNAFGLAATHKIAGIEPYLKDALTDNKLRRSAMRVAGAIKAKSAVPAMVGYAEGTDQGLALVALQALEDIGTDDCVPTFVAKLTSGELPVRKTAVHALAKWPAQAIAVAKDLLTKGLRSRRIGIELLGEVGTEDALALVTAQLGSKEAGVRMEAVRVLTQKDKAKYGPLIEPLKNDPDPDVKALADWALRPKT
jgi:hypothetical protein